MLEIDTYNYSDLEHILKNQKLEEKFKIFHTILIKPNLVHLKSPETGTITHPDSLRSILKYLQTFYKGRIIIGESPSYLEKDVNAIFKIGQLDLIQQEFPQVEIVNLKEFPHKLINYTGRRLRKISLPESISEWGILNLAKMKQHWITGLTAAVKNLVGLLEDPRLIHDEPAYRQNIEIHERIADLYLSIYQNIIVNIVDGIIGMKDGQVNGKTIYPGKIFIGENAVEIDKRVKKYFKLPEGNPKYLDIINTTI